MIKSEIIVVCDGCKKEYKVPSLESHFLVVTFSRWRQQLKESPVEFHLCNSNCARSFILLAHIWHKEQKEIDGQQRMEI